MVLRPNDPVSFSQYPSDNQNDDFHVGAYIDNVLVGVASYYIEKSERLHYPKQSRLRGLAVLPDYREQGVGTELIANSLDIVRGTGSSVLWSAAYPDVCGFFLKMGFIELPEVYQTETGPQKLVYRKI
ncbi:MAG: GNAT family N-acetyltransferase [Bacteroidota bacterium]